MRRLIVCFRPVLCLALVCQLALPPRIWADPASRDLDIEAMRTGATLWVLAIGVSQYADPRISLRYADHDAQRIAQLLQTQQGVLYQEVRTLVLVNEQATREGILKGMSDFLGQASEGDVILIFVAGHGLQDRRTGTYYFVPHDAAADNLVYAGLPMPMFDEAVKRLRTNVDKLILWMDTCHAGAVSVAARGVNAGEDLADALEQASGQYVLSASKAGEESLEDEAYRLPAEDRAHGAFTYSLLKGLRGEAADSNGVVWLGDLFSHVGKEVPRLTSGRQHPHGDIQGTDLPLFVADEAVLQKLSALPPVGSPGGPAAAIAPGALGVPGAAGVPARRGGSRRWVWLLLGAAAAGGAGVALAGGGGGGTAGGSTGTIAVSVPVP